ncbi:MAG: hypothetical protein ABJF01_12110 [bacterium]
MKPVVVLIITMVVSMAGTTGVKVALTKPGHAAASDSAAAGKDTTRTDTAIVASAPVTHPTDSAIVAASTPDSAKGAPPMGTPVVTAPAGAVTKPQTTPALKAPPTAPTLATANAATDTATQSSERRVAKVFTSMDAKQAAKVLEHMSDGDVHIILGYVGPRQAASILAALPPERVATLSKLAMQGKKP